MASTVAGDRTMSVYMWTSENNPETAIFLPKGQSELGTIRVTLFALISNRA